LGFAIEDWTLVQEGLPRGFLGDLSASDIAYRMFVLKIHIGVWEQKWQYYMDNNHNSYESNLILHKNMSPLDMVSGSKIGFVLKEMQENKSVTKMFTDGGKREPMRGGDSAKWKKYYTKMELAILGFLQKKDRAKIIELLAVEETQHNLPALFCS
jgi:hypothetical protein